jgi:2'-5' RNA ligase
MAAARDAGATARDEVHSALQEAARAMQEAREAMRDALRDVRTAVREHDGNAEHAAPASPHMELRFDVTGDPGEALAQLVDRVVGHETEVAILREGGGGTARWVFAVPARPTEQVAALEDELRAELAKLALPERVRVEFRDVVLHHEQHHEER